MRTLLTFAALAASATPLAVSAASAPGQASFVPCSGAHRITCVVDGDTFWLAGTKIRIADINAPELGHPECEREAAMAQRATARLAELLGSGRFELTASGRDEDRYGRKLRVVSRGGVSLGAVLEAEGLAEHWRGRRGSWCGTGADG